MIRKVSYRAVHPSHGAGWLYKDHFGFDKWIITGPDVVVVDFIHRGLSESVLTLFIPSGGQFAMDSPQWRETMEQNWLATAAASAAALQADRLVEDDVFMSKHPALAAFMLSTTGPDGKPRMGCKVTVFADDGHWKATLSDQNTEHSLYVTLERAQDAFQALDKALRAPKPDWRAWKRQGAKGKGGKG